MITLPTVRRDGPNGGKVPIVRGAPALLHHPVLPEAEPIMLKSLYDWTMRLAAHRRAPWALFFVSFAESSVFPIPPDVMLVPMVLARRARAFFYAAVATVGSVLGGVAGYAVGYFLFETIGQWVIRTYGLEAAFETFRGDFATYGLWVILVKGLTPIPYKLVTIACGALQFDLFTFIWASIVTRGLRFFLEAVLLWQFGEPIRDFIERRLTLLTWVFLILLVGGFVAVRFLV